MEKQGIFSVESSCSCFSGPSACYDVQNDGTDGSNAFGGYVSLQISNGGAFSAKKWPESEFSMENGELSLWSLRLLVSPDVKGAVLSNIMGRADLMLLEAMYPNRFPIVGLFQPKNGRKGNFLWKNREFPLWSLRVPVSPGVQGAAISKILGRTDLMLLEAMYPNRFSTIGLFQPKNGQKRNFLWKTREFFL